MINFWCPMPTIGKDQTSEFIRSAPISKHLWLASRCFEETDVMHDKILLSISLLKTNMCAAAGIKQQKEDGRNDQIQDTVQKTSQTINVSDKTITCNLIGFTPRSTRRSNRDWASPARAAFLHMMTGPSWQWSPTRTT